MMIEPHPFEQDIETSATRCVCGKWPDHDVHIHPTVGSCTAQTGPIWKLDGEPCGCVLPDGHETSPDIRERDHVCSCGAWWVDSCRRDKAST